MVDSEGNIYQIPTVQVPQAELKGRPKDEADPLAEFQKYRVKPASQESADELGDLEQYRVQPEPPKEPAGLLQSFLGGGVRGLRGLAAATWQGSPYGNLSSTPELLRPTEAVQPQTAPERLVSTLGEYIAPGVPLGVGTLPSALAGTGAFGARELFPGSGVAELTGATAGVLAPAGVSALAGRLGRASLPKGAAEPIPQAATQPTFESVPAGKPHIKLKAKAEPSPQLAETKPSITPEEIVNAQVPAEKYLAPNINREYLNSTDDVKAAIDVLGKRYAPRIDEARRGTITHAETKQLAERQLGMTAKQLAERRPGEAYSAEQLTGARILLSESATDVAAKAKSALSGSQADLDAFRTAMAHHAGVHAATSGAITEAARTFNALKIKVGGQRLPLPGNLRELDDPEKLKAFAEMISELPTEDAVGRFMHGLSKTTAWDKAYELWINGLLSSPVTHAANFLGNSLATALTVPERAIAAGIGALRKSPTSKVASGEARAMVYGLTEGLADGLRAAGRAFMTGEPSAATRLESNQYTKAIGGKLGEAVRIPGRLLMAGDELFKTIGSRMELHAQALRAAEREGLSGEARAVRARELANGGDFFKSPYIAEKAEQFGKHVTFVDRPWPLVQKLMELRNAKGSDGRPTPGAWTAKVVLPFIRTPGNIARFASERSLLAIPKIIRMEKGAERDLAIAQATIGNAFAGLAALGTLDGTVTGGGPSDPDQQRILRQSGWQPYSIKAGDRYFSYQRLEPLSMIVGSVADAVELYRDGAIDDKGLEERALDIAIAMPKNLASKSFLQGIVDFAAIIDKREYEGTAAKKLTQLAATFVPYSNLAKHSAQFIDPTVREPHGFLEHVSSRLPGLSRTLEPKRALYGEPITREGAIGPDILSPVYTSTDRKDPVLSELARLKYSPELPSRTIGGRKLSETGYRKLSVLTGKLVKRELTSLVKSKAYPVLTDDERRELLKGAMSRARSEAKQRLGLTSRR